MKAELQLLYYDEKGIKAPSYQDDTLGLEIGSYLCIPIDGEGGARAKLSALIWLVERYLTIQRLFVGNNEITEKILYDLKELQALLPPENEEDGNGE